ncbi:type VII secretion integral membrane protein EccD [Jatrophihabitans sp. YIM 134969]
MTTSAAPPGNAVTAPPEHAVNTPTRRVTVVTPTARVDVALPVEGTLAELVPQLVRMSGAAPTVGAAVNPGWTLARLGGAPLEPGLTVAGAGVDDGEILYLQPRGRSSAPLLFDDVVDAIASAAQTRRGVWGPVTARRVALVVAVLAFVGATLLVLPITASPWTAVPVGALALVLLAGGLAVSRAWGDSTAGALCGVAAVPVAFLAGLTVLPDRALFPFQAGPFALAGAGVALAAVIALFAVGDRGPLFVGIAVAGAGAAIASGITAIVPTDAVDTAAVVIAVATALGTLSPMLSLRIARLPLPRVPADVETFRADEGSTFGRDVLDRTTAAEQVLAALLGALGALTAGAAIVLLVGGPDTWAWVLGGVAGLAWLLRSRSYVGTEQRIAAVCTGLVVLVFGGLRLVASGGTLGIAIGAGVTALVGAALVVYAHRVPTRARSPYWGRTFDVVEFICLLAIIPLAGQVLDLYTDLRAAIS